LILDRTHRPWATASAIVVLAGAAVYVPYSLRAPTGPGGGSALGLTFGIAAALLMLFAGLLGARRKVPGWRIGRMQTWMRAHLWLGLVAVPLIFFHGGFSFGHATLTRILMSLLILVSISGFIGALLQHFLPREMTRQLPMETIYEQIDHIREQLREEAEQLLAAAEAVKLDPKEMLPATAAQSGGSVTVTAAPTHPALRLHEFYDANLCAYLSGPVPSHPLHGAEAAERAFQHLRAVVPPSMHETIDAWESICEEERQLAGQERFHRVLHGWLLVHVPLSYALLLLTAVHAIQALRY
jgi:hypothetical protein